MLIGHVEATPQSHIAYPVAVARAVEFLQKQDWLNMADGRYEVDDEGSFAILSRYETKPMADCKPETHKKYVDIQFVAQGEEYLGWCPFSPDLSTAGEYDADRDVVFYEELVPDSNIVLTAGGFAVLFPEDVHRPGASVFDDEPSKVTKVVVKVPVSLIDDLE